MPIKVVFVFAQLWLALTAFITKIPMETKKGAKTTVEILQKSWSSIGHIPRGKQLIWITQNSK
jgi:hypothetical protein